MFRPVMVIVRFLQRWPLQAETCSFIIRI